MNLAKHKLVLTGTVLVVAVLAIAGCGGFRSGGGISPDPGGAIANAVYIGDAACRTCHSSIHDGVMATKHTQALVDLKAAGQDKNAKCLACHTVGYGKKTGYVDEATTPNLGGVQCENCHGPGSEHRGDPKLIYRSEDAGLCGKCHSGSHYPQTTEWTASKHATALTGLKSSSHASSACLECHSADYRLSKVKPTLATAKYAVTCVVCHNPHSAENPSQLRVSRANLCVECHTSEGATPTTTTSPKHATAEFLAGTNGAGTAKTHSHSRIADKCVVCHKYSSGTGSDHDFKINLEACTCHGATVAQQKKDKIQTKTTNDLAALKVRLNLATADQKLTQAYKDALFNYNFIVADGSTGVHNPSYEAELIRFAGVQLATLGL